MAHLPDPKLHRWETGQQISSAVLNHDFGALHALAEYAADLAVTPDPNAAEALQRVGNAESRIAALERRNQATARELGEREYTPLATFGALVQQVSVLRDPLREATTTLRSEVSRRHAAEAALAARLALVESTPKPPAAPSVEAFEQLQAELAEARAEASAAAWQAERLRTDVAELRQHLADTHAERMRAPFVPLSALAGLLKRMDAFQASTAAEDVAAIRGEVARLGRLIADTDRREVLQRQFTPRSAFAYLLKRVERLEGRPT
jgi:hypothetical protein